MSKKEPNKMDDKIVWEVDLHFENLVDNHRILTNYEIIQLQFRYCEDTIEKAINQNVDELIIIHGPGLKEEVHKLLLKYNTEFSEADFLKYGNKATHVFLKNLKEIKIVEYNLDFEIPELNKNFKKLRYFLEFLFKSLKNEKLLWQYSHDQICLFIVKLFDAIKNNNDILSFMYSDSEKSSDQKLFYQTILKNEDLHDRLLNLNLSNDFLNSKFNLIIDEIIFSSYGSHIQTGGKITHDLKNIIDVILQVEKINGKILYPNYNDGTLYVEPKKEDEISIIVDNNNLVKADNYRKQRERVVLNKSELQKISEKFDCIIWELEQGFKSTAEKQIPLKITPKYFNNEVSIYIDKLKKSGKLIVIIPEHTFNRVCNNLINNGQLNTIISFNGSYKNTRGVSILIIEKKLNENVKLIDLRLLKEQRVRELGFYNTFDFENLSRYLAPNFNPDATQDDGSGCLIVPYKKVKENNYDVRFKSNSIQVDGVSIDSVLERCELKRFEIDHKSAQNSFVIRIGDLIFKEAIERNINLEKLKNLKDYPTKRTRILKRVNEECILIAGVGGKLKPTYFDPKISDANFYIDNSIYAITLNREILKKHESKEIRKIYDHIIKSLCSKSTDDQVNAFLRGTTISFISLADIFRIKIPFDIENPIQFEFNEIKKLLDQAEIDLNLKEEIKQILKREITELDYELELTKTKLKNLEERENSLVKKTEANTEMSIKTLQHIIDPSIGILKDYIDQLEEILNKNDLLSDKSDFGEKASSKIIDEANTRLDDIKHYLHNNIFSQKIDEEINILEFINDFIDQNGSELFVLKDNFNLEEGLDVQPTIDSNKVILKVLFEQIIENVKRHSFSGREPKNNEILIKASYFKHKKNESNENNDLEFDDDENYIRIEILNNGHKFSDNFNLEVLTTRGKKTGKNENKGEGGFLIGYCVEFHNKQRLLLKADNISDDPKYTNRYLFFLPII